MLFTIQSSDWLLILCVDAKNSHQKLFKNINTVMKTGIRFSLGGVCTPASLLPPRHPNPPLIRACVAKIGGAINFKYRM